MMDLLDLAQMEKNTFKLNKDFFSIFEVIQQAFMLLGHVANKKQVNLLMPQVDDPNHIKLYQQIYGDKSRFLQVIINFLSNSLKFSKVGSEIKLHLELLENHVLASSEFNGNTFASTLRKSESFIIKPILAKTLLKDFTEDKKSPLSPESLAGSLIVAS
jgi:signal transduction histidine kinase